MPRCVDVPWPGLTESAAELRARAVRMRTLAHEFRFGDVAHHLRDFANELEERARVLAAARVCAQTPVHGLLPCSQEASRRHRRRRRHHTSMFSGVRRIKSCDRHRLTYPRNCKSLACRLADRPPLEILGNRRNGTPVAKCLGEHRQFGNRLRSRVDRPRRCIGISRPVRQQSPDQPIEVSLPCLRMQPDYLPWPP